MVFCHVTFPAILWMVTDFCITLEDKLCCFLARSCLSSLGYYIFYSLCFLEGANLKDRVYAHNFNIDDNLNQVFKKRMVKSRGIFCLRAWICLTCRGCYQLFYICEWISIREHHSPGLFVCFIYSLLLFTIITLFFKLITQLLKWRTKIS